MIAYVHFGLDYFLQNYCTDDEDGGLHDPLLQPGVQWDGGVVRQGDSRTIVLEPKDN